MNALAPDFDGMDAAIFDTLATDASIVRGTAAAVAVRVIVEDGMEKVGQYGQVIGRVTKVSFMKSAWAPARGDVLTLNGVARAVEAIDSDDGYVVGVVLHGG